MWLAHWREGRAGETGLVGGVLSVLRPQDGSGPRGARWSVCRSGSVSAVHPLGIPSGQVGVRHGSRTPGTARRDSMYLRSRFLGLLGVLLTFVLSVDPAGGRTTSASQSIAASQSIKVPPML